MDSIPPPEMEQSDGSSALNPRQKTDIAWKHCYEVPQLNGKTKAIKCAYCDQVICGGGINRMKQHLAGVQGNVKHCKKVPEHVRFEIAGSLIEIAQNKRRSSTQLESDDVQEIPNPKDNVGDSNKRKKTKTIGSYMKASSGIDSSQPSIQVKLQSKERWHETDMAFALWMYDACIPINAVNSPFYEAAISRIATMGHGYTGPSYHALRVPLLKEAKIQVQLTIDSLRSKWIQNGPNLQRLAIKILSQTSSSSGCERNWSVFERIHTKKRNRLEHQRLNDLVFVHYNLRLQKRGKEKKRQYDPIDYECIDKVDFWVVEAEPNGELDYNELEEMLDEDLEDPGRNRGNDDDDFSMFEGGSSNSTDREVHNILRQQRHLLIDEDD